MSIDVLERLNMTTENVIVLSARLLTFKEVF